MDVAYHINQADSKYGENPSLAQTNPKKTAILILIVFGAAPGLGDAAAPNEISGKAN